ncbi:hypothetical protein O9361_18305, partial [Proteus vulgaris]
LSLSGFFAQTPRVDLALPNIGFVAISHSKTPYELLALDTICVSLDEQKLYLTWRYRQLISTMESTLQLQAYKL